MSVRVTRLHGETAQHARLKGLAFLWAQAQGFSACAMEVSLPKCRYRADVAAYRWQRKQPGSTAIFECKQALCDLRRDNCHSEATRRRLEVICQRRQVLEARLRAHYPHLRNGDSLFPELDSQNFIAIGHRGYARLLRDLRALQNQLYDCTKFEKLLRYRCANLVCLVLPEQVVAGHLLWLRQSKQEQNRRCYIGQDSVFAAELCCVSGNVDEMNKVACMRGVG